MRQHEKGRTTEIAAELGVTQRHVQRLCAEYMKTDIPHVIRKAGRRPAPPPDDVVRMVLQTRDKSQTNGKLDRFHRSIEWAGYFESLRHIWNTITRTGFTGRWT